MLRLEASNLTTPRGLPRPRRLLPLPPGTKRRGASNTQHELLPARDDDSEAQTMVTASRSPLVNERWSVKLELGDEEIAKLYGQGMTRGAVVWKKGMVEWRPLLITPELSGLLRRTRITLPPVPIPPRQATIPPVPAATAEPFTLPRPARLPAELTDESPLPISSVAPTALDVEAPTRARRPFELAAVAMGAFALAWIGHAALTHGSSGETVSPSVLAGAASPAAASPAPVCEPTTTLASTSSQADASGIRKISIADLPLAGKSSSASNSSASTSIAPTRAARATRATTPSSSSAGPSRTDLVAALSQVARASSGCGERGGPVRVVVTFTNSGVASSIRVSGDDLPAATRSCIIGAASRARIGAFTGDPVTVSKAL